MCDRNYGSACTCHDRAISDLGYDLRTGDDDVRSYVRAERDALKRELDELRARIGQLETKPDPCSEGCGCQTAASSSYH